MEGSINNPVEIVTETPLQVSHLFSLRTVHPLAGQKPHALMAVPHYGNAIMRVQGHRTLINYGAVEIATVILLRVLVFASRNGHFDLIVIF